MLSKCAVCGSGKLNSIKEQEPRGLLSSLGIKTLLFTSSIVLEVLII